MIYHITDCQTKFKSQNQTKLEQNQEKRHVKNPTNNGRRTSFTPSYILNMEYDSVPVVSKSMVNSA